MSSVSMVRVRRLTVRGCLSIAGALAVLCGGTTVGQEAEVEIPKEIKAVWGGALRQMGGDDRELEDFDKTVKDAKKLDGLFTLYRKKSKLYAEIKPDQLKESYLAPMAIARGLASAGTPLNFGDEWVLTFKRVENDIQLIRKNIRYEAPEGSPLAKAVKQNYTDSILQTIPIVAINKSNQAILIDLGNIFLNDFANLGLGMLDRERTTWHQVKAFPGNLELQVECTYRPGFGSFFMFGDSGIIDSRGITVVLHYSLTKRPEAGYQPRYADYRVGHFISTTKDFGSDDPTSMFRRRINRWRLEKANPKADLSPPKKQIVWWVENTVPHEYRPYVEEGILEWNKAFEKIGFRNALGVRWQNDSDEFDAEDTKYCTFRWITTPSTFAMSGLRADPITGEMIDGDVIFDASWIRVWKNEYALLVGSPLPAAQQATSPPALDVLRVGEVISPMMAARHGFGLPHATPQERHDHQEQTHSGHHHLQLLPSSSSTLQMALSRRIASGRFACCQYAAAKRHEYALAAMALAASAAEDSSEDDENVVKLPEELVSQAIKEVVMHEVGHSLGLRHNFKASTIRSLAQINDPDFTRERGMVGSVMDYNPLNVVRKGEEQGDYAATTIGPYDYWAIEYAYKPIDSDEDKELAKIAERSPEPDLVFATDEDMFLSNDPLVNVYDLGSDPLAYAQDRMKLAKELLDGLDDKIVRDGESWARLRNGFSVLLGQFGNAAYIAASYVGGQHVARDAKGDDKNRDPVSPVDFVRQREALQFLVDEFLTSKNFHFEPSILRRLTTEQWFDWGDGGFFFGTSDFDVYQRVLSIQSIALSHCLDASVLRRIQNQALMADEGAKPLQMAEIFRALTDAVWIDSGASTSTSAAIMRRNLQRDHLKRLCRMVLGERRDPFNSMFGFVVFGGNDRNYPADARSLARAHLLEIEEKIEELLAGDALDDASKAHLEECRDIIQKTKSARLERPSP